MSKEVTAEITSITRLNNSVWGNPRYSIGLKGFGQSITSSDISSAYEIGNPGGRVGDTVVVTFTRSGRIWTIRAAGS